MDNKTAAITVALPGTSWLLGKLRAYADNVALSHSVFALPFAGIAFILASDGQPSGSALVWILAAMVSARSAALALNNLIDLKYDRKHPRFRQRPMVTGEIGRREAALFIVACVAVFLWSTSQLQPICLWLAPFVLLFFVVYPYLKRLTWSCHLFLGITIGLAPIATWVALKGSVSLPILALAAAVSAWIAGFDIVYGCLDVKFDRAAGLHSIPQAFGVKKALVIARLLHLTSVACFIVFGLLASLGLIYYAGTAVAAGVLWYQHRIVQPGDLSQVSQQYFMRNGLVGLSLCLFTMLSFIF
jgi:4-hydroxybenzoate polyprenyltransferase